jgi:hypothetical protein
MSEENNNNSIELSNEELDLVNGGAITDFEAASYTLKDKELFSGLSVGPNGTASVTKATDFTIQSFGAKDVTIS